MYRRQNVIRVDFRKRRKKLKLIIALFAAAVLAVISAFVWWFVHVNSQGDLTSLYPAQLKESLSSSNSVKIELSDGTKRTADVDTDLIKKLDETKWVQTSIKDALSIEADIKFKVKIGSSDCEIRLIDDENAVVAKLNNYYRCYSLTENDFDTLISAFGEG